MKVLQVLQDSTIASKSGKDNRSCFWQLYRQVTEEHDNNFLERYFKDMDSILLFVSLACLSSVSPLCSPLSEYVSSLKMENYTHVV
jgi:hypothetical protein